MPRTTPLVPQKIKELNVTADGNSEVIQSYGGMKTLLASGTFGGATLKVQLKYEELDWVDAGDEVTLTEAGAANFTVNSGIQYRVNVSGAGATDIDYAVVS